MKRRHASQPAPHEATHEASHGTSGEMSGGQLELFSEVELGSPAPSPRDLYLEALDDQGELTDLALQHAAEALKRPDPLRTIGIGEAERHLTTSDRPDSRLLLMGIDEAGRGPWAGPVVAAAVVLPQGFGVTKPIPPELARLNDSKRLTERHRLTLIKPICAHALAVGVGISSPELIDELNIAVANQHAMRAAARRALRALRRHLGCASPPLALIDGKFCVPELPLPQLAMIQGDSRSYHIAAASVVAKVTRDKIMGALDRRHPEYGFARHKGYGTKAHQEALARLGPCLAHRRSYAPVKRALEGREG